MRARRARRESIQFGPLEEMRERAFERLEVLHVAGESSARLYGEDPGDGVGGQGSIFLLLDEPEVYGLPPDPVSTTRDLGSMWRAAAARGRRAAGRRSRSASSVGGGGRPPPTAARDSYYGRPILKAPVWTWEIPAYFFFGGMAGAAAPFALAQRAARRRRRSRGARGCVALAGAAASPPLLIADLGRPERFLHMLRVFKPTSPMSVGSWILGASSAGDRPGDRAHACSAGSRGLGRRGGRRRACSARRCRPTPRCSWPTPPSPCGTRRAASCRSSSPPARR